MFKEIKGGPVLIGQTIEKDPLVPEELIKPHVRVVEGIIAYLNGPHHIGHGGLAIKPARIDNEIKEGVQSGTISADYSHPSGQVVFLHSEKGHHMVIVPKSKEGEDLSKRNLDEAFGYRIIAKTRIAIDSLKGFLHKHWVTANENI